MSPQHAGANGVESAQPQPLDGPPEDCPDSLAHLARGFIGEGHRKDLAREGPARQQNMGEPGGEDARLAGAGARQDQQRAVDGFDGFTLLGCSDG